MIFFPVHRPRIGISFNAHQLNLVELRRPWFRQRVVRRAAERPLPDGALRPSAMEVNVVDRDAVVRELRELAQPCRDRAVAVSLPDRAAHIGLFAFDAVPSQEREREGILRWRFKRDLNVSLGDVRLVYRVFRCAHEGAKDTTASAPAAQILAVAIKQAVLNEYEQVCEAAGLIPMSVGVPLLQTFDFCRSEMKPSKEFYFVYRTDEQLAFLGIKEGEPVFLRVKPARGSAGDLLTDLTGTLQFFNDQYPHQGDSRGESPLPLYMVGGDLAEQGAAPNKSPLRMITPTDNQAWQVEIIPLDWHAMPVTYRTSLHSLSGFSALAGVAVC